MTTQELVKKIEDFENSIAESFTDYFMHDNVKDNSWAFWLLGKGYTERANIIIKLIIDGETCLDQALLYNIYSHYMNEGDDYAIEIEPFNRDLYTKDIELWAEFLLATPLYTERVNKFLKNQEEN